MLVILQWNMFSPSIICVCEKIDETKNKVFYKETRLLDYIKSDKSFSKRKRKNIIESNAFNGAIATYMATVAGGTM